MTRTIERWFSFPSQIITVIDLVSRICRFIDNASIHEFLKLLDLLKIEIQKIYTQEMRMKAQN